MTPLHRCQTLSMDASPKVFCISVEQVETEFAEPNHILFHFRKNHSVLCGGRANWENRSMDIEQVACRFTQPRTWLDGAVP